MDAVEIGRRIAAELFEKAGKDGVDPWNPYEIALHAAHGQGVAVERVAKGHVALAGGRANYDPEFRSIMHEDTGSAFSDAFLVGHEIGHVVLGDDKVADVAQSVEEERTTDAAPIGVDRVQDYGRTQRREIQMDLFARELLLPRPRARALHVESGMSASTISERLGASFGTIAQQMLDALLLPEPLMQEKPARPPRPLNDQQRQAAHHSGGPYLLEAGPGTGKTQTLVGRIEWLLAKGVDPRKILVLTFSNKAASELIERISEKAPEAAAAMWVGTFHAFGLDLLKRYAGQLELPDPPRMIDRAEAIAIIEQEMPRLALTHYRNLWDPTQDINDILQAISRAKDEVASATDYLRLGEGMKARAEAADPVDPKALKNAEKAIEVARVYQRTKS